MSKDKVIDSLGRIDDDMVQKVEVLRHRKKRPVWLKWGAMAACLCLIAAFVVPAAMDIFNPKGGQSDPVQAVAALEFNGLIYEAVDIPAVLERYGLPKEITEDMAGLHRSYLKSDGGVGYAETPMTTDIELYEYAPAPCRGVMLLRNGDHWYAALLVGFSDLGAEVSVDLGELYRIYGIDGAADITSVAKYEMAPLMDSGRNHDRVISRPVTDPGAIQEFYDMTTSLYSFTNSEFQNEQFQGIPEEQAQEAHNAFAAESYSVCVETSTGLRFFMRVYPESGWIYANGTSSYYQISEEMDAWLAKYMG